MSLFPASPLPEPFSLSFLRFFFSFSFFADADPLSLLSVVGKADQSFLNHLSWIYHCMSIRSFKGLFTMRQNSHLVGF